MMGDKNLERERRKEALFRSAESVASNRWLNSSVQMGEDALRGIPAYEDLTFPQKFRRFVNRVLNKMHGVE